MTHQQRGVRGYLVLRQECGSEEVNREPQVSTALYRRYRSAQFADLIGQPHIVTTLLNQMRSGRAPHAYLFAGIRGTGKTSAARIVARAINCLEPTGGEPCNTCAVCTEISRGSSVDVLEIDAASNRGIDDVRELRERVNYLPASLRRKVYIVDEAHMLTADAWNAFLKTLEEPPEHVLFILATTEPHKIPDTVRSRTQRFDFRRVGADEISTHLSHIARCEDAVLSADAADLVARSAQGSVRDALSLLDQVLASGDRPVGVEVVRRALGLADPAIVRDILVAVGGHDPAAAIRGVAAAFDAGTDAQQLLREASRMGRAAALAGIGLPAGPGSQAADEEVISALARAAPAQFWIEALEVLSATEMNLKQVADARLQVELCILRLVCRPPEDVPNHQVGALALRVSALEAAASQPSPAAAVTISTPTVTAAVTASTATADQPGPASDSEARGDGPLVDLASWLTAWPQFLDSMNRRDFMLAGLLKDCRPVDASPGTLVVGALHNFHLEQIRAEPKPRLLSEVATEVAGHPITVTTVFLGREPRESGAAEVADATQAALATFRGSRLVGSRPRELKTSDLSSPEPGS